MYQNCCKKCGSLDLHTEIKGGNTGLYCSDCGAWIKWLGKDELRAFENAKVENHQKLVDNRIDDIGVNIIKRELKEFIDFLDKEIDKELCRTPLSPEDAVVKCSVAMAYEKDKNALINILNGRRWNDRIE